MALDIELPPGVVMDERATAVDWHGVLNNQPSGESRLITPLELLNEDHHRWYGRPWIMGRLYTEVLKEFGLRPSDGVLDIGCGAGRVGGPLCEFLDQGRYFGIEAHLNSLIAFAAYECFVHDITAKRPRLLLSQDFEVEAFSSSFDVALDFMVTHHLSAEFARAIFVKLRGFMPDGGRLFQIAEPRIGLEAMASCGFALVRTREIAYPHLASLPTQGGQVSRIDVWHEFAAI